MTRYFMAVFTPHKEESFLTAETTRLPSNRTTGLNIKFRNDAERTRMKTRPCIHHRFRNSILSSWNGSVQRAQPARCFIRIEKKFCSHSIPSFHSSLLWNRRISEKTLQNCWNICARSSSCFVWPSQTRKRILRRPFK